jgi:hypothetical protein
VSPRCAFLVRWFLSESSCTRCTESLGAWLAHRHMSSTLRLGVEWRGHFVWEVWRPPFLVVKLLSGCNIKVTTGAWRVHSWRAFVASCDNLPEKISYYHLSHSIWPLSDNKVSSRRKLLGQAPWNHLYSNKGSNICIKTYIKASPEYITQFKSQSTHKDLIIANHSSWHDNKRFRVWNNEN